MRKLRVLILSVVRNVLVFTVMAPFLLACSYFPVSSKKYYYVSLEKKPFDAIIVPGMPFNGKKWSLGLKARIYWSKYLYDEGITRNIIYSGSAAYSPYTESEIMSIYAQKLGVPQENIYMETKAEYSSENLYYSYQLAKENGFSKIALATDPFQTRKLLKFIEKFNMDIHLLPIVFDTLEQLPQPTPAIDPAPAFVTSFKSVKERYSIFERLRGTRGKRIK